MNPTPTAAPAPVGSPAEAIATIHEARRERWAASAREFMAVAAFADHYLDPDETPMVPGTERMLHWAGEGAPAVAEFCSLELMAALRISDAAAITLIRDSLAVRHRFPTLWRMLAAGEVEVWRARDIITLTSQATLATCTRINTQIIPRLNSLGWRAATEWIKAIVLEDAGQAAQSEHEKALASRRVTIGESHLGVTTIDGVIGAADAVFLDAQLNRLAHILAEGGNTNTHDVRRAQALGLMATPPRALQLLQASLTDQLPDDLDAECPAAGQRGHTCGTITQNPDQLLPRTNLVLHLTDTTTATGEGLVRGGTRLGPLAAGWLQTLLGHTRITIRPVIDLNNVAPVDAYECPQRMREAVELLNPVEVFPHSQRGSHRLDLDHTQPWQQPTNPGSAQNKDSGNTWANDNPTATAEPVPQTRLDNLGPLTRKTHRAKTHGGWRLTQPHPGVFHWTSPVGYGYTVTGNHTHLTHDPTGRILTPPATSSTDPPDAFEPAS